MAKQGEIDYIKLIGPKMTTDARDKPFSQDECGRYLLDMGAVMSLLPNPPGKVLDLGVGTGWTSVFMAKRGYDVVGQDIANDMIELAEFNKARAEVDALRFIVSDYESMGFSNEFDAAVFYDCLHHAEDEVAALKAVYDALKPGGICLTFEPGKGHAESPESIKAMEMYGVTERDMPPALIVEGAMKAGFRTFQLFQRIHTPQELFPYAPDPSAHRPEPRPVGLFNRGSPLRRGIKQLDPVRALKRWRSKPQPARPTAAPSIAVPDVMNQSHIVLLRK